MTGGELRPKIAGRVRRNMEDYEKEGRKFYKLASEHQAAITMGLSELFWLLHENFSVAKKPVNFISDNYLRYRKDTLFGVQNS